MEMDEFRAVVATARLAPSVHNTQPWRFELDGEVLQVRADPGRQLHYVDPSARQLHISCGAAVEFARLAVRSLGYACTVRLAPSPEDVTLLATLTVGHQFLAMPEERRLLDAVPRRYTDRGAYDDRSVPTGVLRRVRELVEGRGCWLRVLDRAGDRVAVSQLLDDAEGIEAASAEYRDELAGWQRDGHAVDGIRTDVHAWRDGGRVSDVPLRDFTGHGAHRRPGGEGKPPAVERDTLVLLGTDGDNRLSHLRAGRALADLLLELTAAGLVSQPLGPVTDLGWTRQRLRLELGIIGHPQLMLRVGYGHARPVSGRRSVEDLLAAAPA